MGVDGGLDAVKQFCFKEPDMDYALRVPSENAKFKGAVPDIMARLALEMPKPAEMLTPVQSDAKTRAALTAAGTKWAKAG